MTGQVEDLPAGRRYAHARLGGRRACEDARLDPGVLERLGDPLRLIPGVRQPRQLAAGQAEPRPGRQRPTGEVGPGLPAGPGVGRIAQRQHRLAVARPRAAAAVGQADQHGCRLGVGDRRADVEQVLRVLPPLDHQRLERQECQRAVGHDDQPLRRAVAERLRWASGTRTRQSTASIGAGLPAPGSASRGTTPEPLAPTSTARSLSAVSGPGSTPSTLASAASSRNASSRAPSGPTATT